MADCICGEYGPLELRRVEINRRIRATRRIRRRLMLLAESSDERHRLYQCPACGQFWQQSWSWPFGAKDYIYQVPAIDTEEWLGEPYARPDMLLIYTATMARYESENDFTASSNRCRIEGCPEFAVEGLVLCVRHQIESLWRVGLLPSPPKGRMFAPYHFRDEEERAS